MTLQNQRERAEELQLTEVPRLKESRAFGTFGSKGDHYEIEVSKRLDTRQFGNMLRGITIFNVDCQQSKANISNDGKASMQVACKGNCQKHTICYHGLGALLKIFDGKEISFQRSISNETARSGNVSLVKSANGGELWIVEEEAKTKVTNSEIVNLMHGDEDFEGID